MCFFVTYGNYVRTRITSNTLSIPGTPLPASYSKTCLKRTLKNRQNNDLDDRRSKVLQNAPLGASCNTFDMHQAIVGLENQFIVFLRVAVLDRFL